MTWDEYKTLQWKNEFAAKAEAWRQQALSGNSMMGTNQAMTKSAKQVDELLRSVKAPNATQITNTSLNIAEQAATKSLENVVGKIPQVVDSAVKTGAKLDEQVQNIVYGAMNKFAPGWQEAVAAGIKTPAESLKVANDFFSTVYPEAKPRLMGLGNTAAGQAEQMLRGQVPTDVLQNMRQNSAEKAIAGLGVSGEDVAGTSGRNLLARDLGLTSVDMMAKGQSMAGTAKDMYSALQGLSSTASGLFGNAGSNMANVLGAVKGLLPDSTGDAALTMASSLVNALAKAGTVSPESVLSLTQNAQNQALELDWVKALSRANNLMGVTGSQIGNNMGAGLFGGLS